MSIKRVPIGDILELRREPISIDPTGRYRRIGIYSWGKGMIQHPAVEGAQMGSLRYFRFPANALVLSNIQAWEAAVAVSTESESAGFVCSNRFLPYVPQAADCVDVRYLLQYFLSEVGLGALRRASPGTQVRNRTLGKGLFEAIEVPLPDIDEQRRIAAHLDRVGSAQRARQDGTALWDAAPQSIRNAVFDRLVAEHVSIDEILELRRRAVTVDDGATYREIGVRSFGRGLFVKEPRSGTAIGEKRIFYIQPGDLVVSNVFAWEGAIGVARASHEGTVGSHRFMTWTPTAGVDTRFLAQYLVSADGLAKLRQASPGSAGRNRTLSIKNLRAITVPVPDLKEQRRIASLLEKVDTMRILGMRRQTVVSALLPAARNQIFNAMR